MPRRHMHAFDWMNARRREGLVIAGRRSVLKASLAGIGGLSLAGLLESQSKAENAGQPVRGQKSVILLWMTGGPSHIDTWDVKPDAPAENRGPFATIETKLPGVRICEHLPKQAAMMDKLTIIRSVDATFSNHEPNRVMQSGNLEAEPRLNPNGELYPAIGSVVAKHIGTADPTIPPYVVLNLQDVSHVARGGYLGRRYDPFNAKGAERLLRGSAGLKKGDLITRTQLRGQLDGLRRDLDASGAMDAVDRFGQQALEIILGQKARAVFDLANEPSKVRDRYGPHPWLAQALLARRLVEAGVRYVTIDLSNHSASGTWDTHGDNIPPYGGISKGLKPLLPVFDHLLTTLVSDLDERGLLENTLVLAMGEFGRTPKIGTQGSTDGRDHWPSVMSMTVAGGGFRHGQVIGASSRDGGAVKDRRVTPGDLAATIYHHMGVPLDLTYEDTRGRPRNIVEHGKPIEELVG